MLLLDGNRVTDVRALAQMAGLANLGLAGNPIADLWPLTGLGQMLVADRALMGAERVPASAGPDQRVRTSNPRLEFDCRHGFDVRVTPRDN